jgi:predicted transcriptional regulator YheO
MIASDEEKQTGNLPVFAHDLADGVLPLMRPAVELNNKAETMRLLREIAAGLRRLFAPICEVIIHDFADFEHSIVYVEGNITNRRVGDAATDLLLARVGQGQTDENLYNYITDLPGGRTIKSCTIFLRDPEGIAYGAFCVNVDITAFVDLHKAMSSFVIAEDPNDSAEGVPKDIEETIHVIVTDTLRNNGQTPAHMTREAKIELIGRLAEKGVFQVKKSVPMLADLLGLSRATVYNYLREARLANSSSQALDD